MKLTATERHELKTELAKTHELSDSAAARLKGETEDELRADASDLASALREARPVSNAASNPTNYAFQKASDVAW